MAKVAVPSATTAVISGSAMPSSEPKAMQDDDGGGDQADGHAVGGRRLAGLLDGLAADLDLQARLCRPPSTRSMTCWTSCLGSAAASLVKTTVA